jgi:hypothetical protein
MRNLDDFRRVGRSDTNRHVAENFAIETITQVAARQELALSTRHRGRVDTKAHTDDRIVHDQSRQRRRRLHARQGVPDFDFGNARDDEQIPGLDAVDVDSADSAEHVQCGDPTTQHRRRIVVGRTLAYGHGLALAQSARIDAPDTETPEVVRRIEVRDERAQHPVGIALGFGKRQHAIE